jgi:hypothetical protein
MLNDFGTGKVTINKETLLDAIRLNRNKHQEEYVLACKAYRAAAIQELTLMLDKAVNKAEVIRQISCVEPVSHVKEYNKTIRMLEMSTADEITVTERQFCQFVLDEWEWSHHFKSTVMSYGIGSDRG